MAMAEGSFRNWIVCFVSHARQVGIEESVLEEFERRVRFNAEVWKMASSQAEHVLPIWEYLDVAVSAKRVSDGSLVMQSHGELLADIEARFRVEADVLAAIWGIETAYGTKKGSFPVIDALSTLACIGHRRELFDKELIAALQIVQSGCSRIDDLIGSWAGAMGHMQFMPSSYLAFAVDFHDRGTANIWCDDPTDSFASAANFLHGHGWEPGLRWAVRVSLPSDFDYLQCGLHQDRLAEEWIRSGVEPLDQVCFPNRCRASIVLPVGAQGPAFLATGNFHVIREYNRSLSYVFAVGHLSDRIGGRSGFRTRWPQIETPLSREEIAELQELLVALGHDTGGVDGIAGPATTFSIQHYQSSVNLVPDGFPHRRVLERLRG